MKAKTWLIVVSFLANSAFAAAQTTANQPDQRTSSLTNRDVLMMVKRGMTADEINAQIVTSPCTFDTFPPVLKDLKRRGVPDTVLLVMARVPNGPSDLPMIEQIAPSPPKAKVRLPAGLGILVETLYPVSSADVKEGSTIAFVVPKPVYINGVLAIVRGTVARAKVVRAVKAQSWGRPGALTWQMEEIRAVDGTKIPVQLSAAIHGDARGIELAAGLGATAAVLFPYTAPAALVWGFKKGDDAILRGSRQFSAVLPADAEVLGVVQVKDKLIYHYAEGLKAKLNSNATQTAFPRMEIRH